MFLILFFLSGPVDFPTYLRFGMGLEMGTSSLAGCIAPSLLGHGRFQFAVVSFLASY